MENIKNWEDRNDVSPFLKGLIRYLKNSYYINQNTSIVGRSDDSRNNSWFLVVSLSCCCFVSVICLQLIINSVCFFTISVQPWTVLVDCWLTVEEFPTKIARLPRDSRDKSFFLRQLIEFVPQFWVFDHTLSCFGCSSSHLCLSSTVLQFHLVSLRPLVGLQPPSNFFIHSPSTRSVQDTTPEGILSLNTFTAMGPTSGTRSRQLSRSKQL